MAGRSPGKPEHPGCTRVHVHPYTPSPPAAPSAGPTVATGPSQTLLSLPLPYHPPYTSVSLSLLWGRSWVLPTSSFSRSL